MPRRRSLDERAPWWVWGGWVCAWWGWLFWSCAGEWSKDGLEFGWVVPPLAVYFLFRRLEETASRSLLEERSGGVAIALLLALLCLALGVLPLEVVRLAPIPWRVPLWVLYGLAAAATFLVALHARSRALWLAAPFPVLFAGLALPWPTAIEQVLTGDLAQALAAASAEVMRWLGVPALASGKTVTLELCTVGIEQACSGLRSLQSAMILSLGLGELWRLRLGARALLFLAALCIALAENFCRLVMLCFLASEGGPSLLERWHDTAGLFGLALLTAGTFVVARRLRKRKPGPEITSDTTPVRWQARPMAGWLVIPIVSLLGFAGAHAWYLSGTQSSWEPALLVRTDHARVAPPPGPVLAQLNPSEGGYLIPLSGAPDRLSGYHFYWRPSRGNPLQLFHRPDVCMPGVGWRLIGEPRPLRLQTGSLHLEWWLFTFEREGKTVNLLWTSLIDGQAVSIAFGGGVNLQGTYLFEVISRRISAPSYEVAALVLDPHGAVLTQDLAQKAVDHFFSGSPGLEGGKP